MNESERSKRKCMCHRLDKIENPLKDHSKLNLILDGSSYAALFERLVWFGLVGWFLNVLVNN